MTVKGDRWEGDGRLGRSEPAFLAASTTALPPSTCTARREAGQHRLRLLFCCEAGHLRAVCSLRPGPGRSSAVCVRLQWPCSAGCVPVRLCHAMPTALNNVLAPVHFALLCPCSFPCAPGSSNHQFASCKTVLLAAATRACSGGPCAGSI